jgi:hypothetical protein
MWAGCLLGSKAYGKAGLRPIHFLLLVLQQRNDSQYRKRAKHERVDNIDEKGCENGSRLSVLLNFAYT